MDRLSHEGRPDHHSHFSDAERFPLSLKSTLYRSRQVYSLRKQGSEDSNGASRSAEAMKNPDWRRRGTNNGSSASNYTTHTDSGGYELVGMKSRQESSSVEARRSLMSS